VAWIAAGLVAVAAVPTGFRLAAAWRETAEAVQLAPAAGRFIDTRSGRMFVQEAGPADGIAVLLFHGTAAWSELWHGTMAALADAGYRAIAFDLPPFGFSDRPKDLSYTRVDQAERAHDILDALRIEEAIVVGHSFGAGAAIETVLRYPQRIEALVLVDAALGEMDRVSPPPAVLRLSWLRQTLVSATVTNPLATRTLLKLMIARKDRATSEYVEILQRPLRLRKTTRDIGDWLVYFAATDDRAASAHRAAIAAIPAKVALLWGEMDTITPMPLADDLHSLISGSTLTVLPGVGHIPQIEDPPEFHRALIEQLRRFTVTDPSGRQHTTAR
jgi:pimeloyl-ACP methyl ester carboxylesterase